MAVKVVIPTRRPRSTPQKHTTILKYVRDRVNPIDIHRLEGVCKLKKKIHCTRWDSNPRHSRLQPQQLRYLVSPTYDENELEGIWVIAVVAKSGTNSEFHWRA
jgi:hypothetical protein